MARLRPPEAVRRRPGKARLGALPRCRRARLARARGEHPAGACRAGVAGLSHGTPEPLSWPLALAWRGLPGLEPAPFQPAERALERRSRAREGALRGDARHARWRPDARLLRRSRRVSRPAEPLHHARRAPGVRARPQLGRLPFTPLARRALLQVLHPAPWLPRWGAGTPAHLHRLHQQLYEVREASRAPQGGKIGTVPIFL